MAISLEKWNVSKDPADLLSGTLLVEGRTWLARQPDFLNAAEIEFLKASEDFAAQQTLDTQKLRDTEKRLSLLRWRVLLPASLVIALLGSAAAIWLPEKTKLSIYGVAGLVPRDYLLSPSTTWLDDILLNPEDSTWAGRDKWNEPAPQGWTAVAGQGFNPKDGALLIKGSSIGTLNIGNNAFFDYLVQFDLSFYQGTKAAWMVRVQKDGQQGYLFELEQQPPGLVMRAWRQAADGSRVPLTTPNSQIELNCCHSGDVYRITAVVDRFQFRYTVRSPVSSESTPSILRDTVFLDPSSKFRYGNIGFLETDAASVTKLEYVYVQRLPVGLQ